MDDPHSTVSGRPTSSRRLIPFSPNTLRARFLLILLGVLLPSLTLFGVLHHDLVKRSLLDEVDKSLVNRAVAAEKVLTASEINLPSDFSKFRVKDAPLGLESAPEVYVDVLSLAGETLWTSGGLAGGGIPFKQGVGVPGYSTIATEDGLPLRTFTRVHSLSGGEPVLVVVAESLLHLESALQASAGRSVLLGVLILVFTELVGSWALRGVFAPLDKLVDTAEFIVSTDDVAQRVPIETGSQEEIRRTAVAFNSLMERVEELLEIAKRLLADTSHELRNPLTVLLADLDLLRNELSADQREEVVDEAQSTVRRMARLVSDLLLLSRTEAHSEHAHTEVVELQAFVDKVVGRLAGSLKGAERVKICEQVDGDAMALVNRQRTEQILTNLLENAIRHTNEGRVDVSVRGLGGDWVVSVRDYGEGVPPEEQEKIFRRFYRLDRSRSRDSGGTGLGLALARALARSQGGDVTLKSELGGGSDFQMRLPKAESSEVD